jgi:Flp pilus assembly protein TadD
MALQEREIRERFRQGVIMLHAGEHDFAVTAFRRVLQLSPDMPEAHVNMGFAQFGQGHYTVARDFFISAIDLRPDQANAYWGLAVSLEALCDFPGARGAMRSYIHLSDPDNRFLRKAGAALMEWEVAGVEGAQGCISASGSGSVSPMGRNLK